MPARICLATNFLPFTGATARMWTTLHEALAVRRVGLVLLSSTLPKEPAPYPVTMIPLFLSGYARSIVVPRRTNGAADDPQARSLLERDAAWSGGGASDLEDARAGYGICRYVAEIAREEIDPTFALLWSPVLPQSVVFRQAMRRAGIPACTLERGLLPDTLMIEDERASFTEAPFFVRDGSRDPDDMDEPEGGRGTLTGPNGDSDPLFERVRAHYLDNRPEKYPQGAWEEAGELRRRLGLGDGPVVVFLGQHDVATGLVPRDAGLSARLSPWFESTGDALASLSEVVGRIEGATLVFKPHPKDPASPDGPFTTTGANLHALCALADVVVAMSTTAQFEALLHERPLLLMGRSALTGSGAGWEPEGPGGLEEALRSALDRDGYDQKRSAARRFVAHAFEERLIGCEPGVPSEATLEDLADLIVARGLDVPGAGDWDAMERLHALSWRLDALRVA